MKDLIRVLIIEDHLVARIGISSIISSQPDMTVVAEAANGNNGIELFREHQPDVTLMDLRLPDLPGTDAIKIIKNIRPSARIIVLSSHSGDVEIRRSLQSGASGYVLKDVLHKELIEAIRLVHAGKRYIAPNVAALLTEHLGEEDLTPAELRVLEMIVGGNSNKEISFNLKITENTVKAHVKSILSKLNAPDRTAAAITAVRRGIVHIEK
jgi:DNA-binding NarL/FixJ family response regulator